jgi:UDP-glucose 4-epimerase
MKILVTGSSGTIGTRLCERLAQNGHELVCVDWRENQWSPAINKQTLIVDLRDLDAAETMPGDVDIVVHLAANARVYDLVVDPTMARDNFLSLFNTLEFCRRKKVKRFIFASSRESYGNIDVAEYTEDMARVENCESPYTASKIGGEALVWSYDRCYDVKALIFRFSNVYGMYDDSNRVIPLFIRAARENKPLTVFGEEKCLDFTYIDDCVSGIIAGIEKFDTANGEVYNLAFGEGTTIVHLAKRIQELLKSDAGITMQPSRIGEVTRYIANIDKAKRVLSYNPTVSFEEGLKKTVEWYLANT